jgi:hypothetical protein
MARVRKGSQWSYRVIYCKTSPGVGGNITTWAGRKVTAERLYVHKTPETQTLAIFQVGRSSILENYNQTIESKLPTTYPSTLLP